MPEEKGIKNLKEVLALGLSFGQYLESAVSKGPMKPESLAKMMDVVSKAPEAFEGIGQVDDEYYDLSDDEMIELKDYVKSEFDLEDDKAEGYVKTGLSAALHVAKAAQLFISKDEKPE